LGKRDRISIVGCVGVPNRYGGFESFAEAVGPALVARGYEVTVTCDRGQYLNDRAPTFCGVNRVFIGIPANGALSVLHDLVAFFRVVASSDRVLVLGVSGGLFFPIFRIACEFAGCRLLVNVDGVEWRRDKFGFLTRMLLYAWDWLAQRFAHVVIYDNIALQAYVRFPKKSTCVEYSGEHAVDRLSANSHEATNVLPQGYALSICRIEPENNCELLIEGFLASALKSYILVGNWGSSRYGRLLRRKYAGQSRLLLMDPIYDAPTIYRLRSGCACYLHGHSIGGTNPSLVEMLFFDCPILCYDCSFNRVTAGEGAEYFATPGALRALLDSGRLSQRGDREELRMRYRTSKIVDKLICALG